MNPVLCSLLQTILLVVALSIDAFAASFAYGTNRIRIPFLSVTIITAVCTVLLAVSLLLGTVIRPFLPAHLTGLICFVLLFLLGIVKLFDSTIKSCIRKHKNLSKEIKFSMFNLNFILNVYADPQDADQDFSRMLSPLEAGSLAIALSLDGLAVGFGAGLVHVNFIQVILFSLIANTLAIVGGCFFGNKIAEKTSLDLSWLSGIILIVLAVMKL